MPARLAQPAERRLGHYFERLYEVLLKDLLGWELLLKNQQIKADNRTIGELDFVVRNRQTGCLEHHEIAIKYYLGVNEDETGTRWYGPNAKDRDRKSTRLNSSHVRTSYAVFCLKKKNTHKPSVTVSTATANVTIS